MDEITESLVDAFRDEARELLVDMEAALLELEGCPGDQEQIARAFRALHTLKGNGAMFGFEELERFAHTLEHVFDLLRKGQMAISQEIIDLTLGAKDRLLALLTVAGESPDEVREREDIGARIARVLEAAGQAGTAAGGAPAIPVPSRPAPGPPPGAGHIGRKPGVVIDLGGGGEGDGAAPPAAPAPPAERASGAVADGGSQPPAPARARVEVTSTLRVAAAKLDTLVNLVGELVTVQARLARVAGRIGDAELDGVAEEVERLTAGMRDNTLSVRMVPIGPSFAKFRRHVRDLAHEVGHEVDLVTEGEDTELDKTVIDRLADPIVHLLRNSIDHGIETPDVRERAGKPRRGTVRLTASYSGASVIIRVEDDGAGIDLEAVRRKAVERGLLAEHDARSERELIALMFLPGFSTSGTVTTVSGRGVGLDVVKRAVETLRGQINVESRLGAGTTFEVRLPLTLAIIEGLDVVVGGEHFILPLAVVNECVELLRDAAAAAGPRRLAEIRGELVPYVRLRDWFAVDGEAPRREQIVVTEAEGFRVGLVVDAVVGEQQTVIKPLGRLFGNARGLAGATILGDGTVALILDVAQLVQSVERARDGAGAAG